MLNEENIAGFVTAVPQEVKAMTKSQIFDSVTLNQDIQLSRGEQP